MKKHKRIVILCIICLVLVLSFFFLNNAGKFLVLEDQIEKADAIVVLSGDRGERVEKAAELYRQGYGKYFVISGGPVYEDVTIASLMKEHAMGLGVPESVMILEDRADSTY